jgi:polysaccharide pyruvyl transferase WcaK-like protein
MRRRVGMGKAMSVVAADRRQPGKVGIVGHYGGDNLGDETVVAILIKAIRTYYPSAEVCGFSMNPTRTERRHGIKAFPLRLRHEKHCVEQSDLSAPDRKASHGAWLKERIKQWPRLFECLKRVKDTCCAFPVKIVRELAFLRRCLQRLKGFDLLIVPGSGAITDWWGGAWSQPYTFLSWSLLSTMTGTRVVALSIGCERINTRLGQSFCVWALWMAAYCSFRDRPSRDLMEALGLKGEKPVVPDQGFGLLDLIGVGASVVPSSGGSNGSLVVGISPIGKGCCVRPDAWDGAYDRYREKLAAFSLWLIQEGHSISFCLTDELFDRELVQPIVDTIKAACAGVDLTGRILERPIATTEELIARICQCDVVVASRFHGVVLPLVLQRPVLGIALYAKKISDVMSGLGLAEYYLQADKADMKDMISAFRRLQQNRQAIAHELAIKGAEYRARLAKQYEHVFGTTSAEMHAGDEIPWKEAGKNHDCCLH